MSDSLCVPTSLEIEVKHSRFIAHASAATSPEAALAFIQSVSDVDATHNCWAYRMGSEYRSSDDGEPSGTAGRPILAAIDGQGYDHVAVVVTRWYGGIKLGAGGLVRAYGGTAAECLRRGERLALIETQDIAVLSPFDALGSVHTALSSFGAEKLSEQFDENGARLQIRLPADRVDALKIHLRDATRDRVHIQSCDR